MIAALSTPITNSNHIRQLDVSRDLETVADLIEGCFPIHLDPDGQVYVREMREAARDMRYLRWFTPLAELGRSWATGFVWEESDRIVGILSLIPFQQSGQSIHLIANVAVHPDYRRRGIARALTSHALGHLRRRNEPRVWLQVRDDNPAALALYQALGFKEQFRRTTWRIKPSDLKFGDCRNSSSVSVRRRKNEDWPDQKVWLQETYPFEMRWNLPVDFNNFETGKMQRMFNLLGGTSLRHWTVAHNGEVQGVMTWQKTDSYAHNLWFAFEKENEVNLIPGAVFQIFRKLSSRHPLSIDYPYDRCALVFKDLGFKYFRTLVWMACKL